MGVPMVHAVCFAVLLPMVVMVAQPPGVANPRWLR